MSQGDRRLHLLHGGKTNSHICFKIIEIHMKQLFFFRIPCKNFKMNNTSDVTRHKSPIKGSVLSPVEHSHFLLHVTVLPRSENSHRNLNQMSL